MPTAKDGREVKALLGDRYFSSDITKGVGMLSDELRKRYVIINMLVNY
jgi:hypothetical protein